MAKNPGNIEFGNSPDYATIMWGIVTLAGLGLLSTVVINFGTAMTIIFIIAGALVITGFIVYQIVERHKDYQAFYGPLPQDGEENTEKEQ